MKPLVFDFSGIFVREEYAWEQQGEVWHLAELTGTDCYLDPETEGLLRDQIQRRAREEAFPKIHCLDSGNYHYMSKLLMEIQEERFFLVVFDHHTDMQPPALLPVVSCGSWIRDALLLQEQLAGVCVIGPPEREIARTEQMDRVFFVSEEELREGSAGERIREILCRWAKGLPLWISVDKDVLTERSVRTNWDQGILKTEELEELLWDSAKGRRVSGVDLCGEPGMDGTSAEYQKSSRINRRLAELAEQLFQEAEG